MCDHGETGILEVKCPYSARNVTVADAVNTDMQFCMKLRELCCLIFQRYNKQTLLTVSSDGVQSVDTI